MTEMFAPRCCDSEPLSARGPRVYCDLPSSHRSERWHEGTAADGTRWTWWGVGCPLQRPRPQLRLEAA